MTGSMEIVLFSTIIDKVESNKCYNFKDMRVQKFDNIRILKSTETTTVTDNNESKIVVSDDEIKATSFSRVVKGKVVKIDGKTLIPTYLCSTCSAPATITNAVGWCKNCDNVSTQDECNQKTDVKLTILDQNENLKLFISVPHSIMETQLKVTFSNGTKSEVIMKLINKLFLFTLNKTNTCLDISIEKEKETKSESCE